MKKYLIAGATSDMAKTLISKLATNDENKLFLLARDKNKLAELNSLYSHTIEGCATCDFATPESLHNHIGEFIKLNAPFDGFVYCAGITRIEKISKLSYVKNREILNINYCSFVELLRIILTHQNKRQPLRVIAISSTAANKAVDYTAAYAASKAALNAFIKSCSSELIKRHCVINAVSPSYVQTKMLNLNFAIDENFAEAVKAKQPLGLIPPQAIAEEIMYLLTKTYCFESGTNIIINGGAGI